MSRRKDSPCASSEISGCPSSEWSKKLTSFYKTSDVNNNHSETLSGAHHYKNSIGDITELSVSISPDFSKKPEHEEEEEEEDNINININQDINPNNKSMQILNQIQQLRLQNALINDLNQEKTQLKIENIKLKSQIRDKSLALKNYQNVLKTSISSAKKAMEQRDNIKKLTKEVNTKSCEIIQNHIVLNTIASQINKFVKTLDDKKKFFDIKIDKIETRLQHISDNSSKLTVLETKKLNDAKVKTILIEKDQLIERLRQEKINLIQEASKLMNIQRDIICQYHTDMSRRSRS